MCESDGRSRSLARAWRVSRKHENECEEGGSAGKAGAPARGSFDFGPRPAALPDQLDDFFEGEPEVVGRPEQVVDLADDFLVLLASREAGGGLGDVDAGAVPRDEQAFLLEFAVGADDGIRVDDELLGEFADRGELV